VPPRTVRARTSPRTNQWSPVSTTEPTLHSIHAIAPSRTGAPLAPCRQERPANLSPPLAAKARLLPARPGRGSARRRPAPISEHFRTVSDRLLLEVLEGLAVPVHIVTGSLAERTARALSVIQLQGSGGGT
jgi:hypothetical protein